MLWKGSSASSRTSVSWVILGLMVLLILVGVVSGGAYLYLQFSGSSQSRGPVQQLREDEVEPSLALPNLAGASDLQVVNGALTHLHLATAYSTILFSRELTDGERIGSLLLLASAYAGAGDSSRARLRYQDASLIATLSPALSDSAKASAFLEIGGGLAKLGNKREALSTYHQAKVVALHSTHMRAPHRADVLGKLSSAFQALGESELASECSAHQAEVQYVFGEPGEASEGPSEQPVSPFMTEIPEPTEAMIASYEQRRVETVQQLIDFLQGASEEGPVAEELMTDVTQALLNEDEARRGIYEQQLVGASSMVLRMGITEAKVDWLIIKYRVALGAYGLQLVPAWTEALSDVEAELNAAYRELHETHDEQISTLSDTRAVDQALFHLLRFEIEQGRLGLYPDYPEEELLSQLTEVSQRLIASGDLSVYVDVVYEGDAPLFTLAAPES